MSRAPSARLFAALDPPDDVAEELLRWARGALREAVAPSPARPRLLAAESLHVTLIFLGERPFEELDELAAALLRGAEGLGACELETGAPVWLPPRRPRALAVEVHDRGGGELADLQHRVAAALCGTAGLPVPRRFRPHLTVARTRSAPPPRELAATPALRFTAAEVVLYRSHLEPAAARYERLAAVALSV